MTDTVTITMTASAAREINYVLQTCINNNCKNYPKQTEKVIDQIQNKIEDGLLAL